MLIINIYIQRVICKTVFLEILHLLQHLDHSLMQAYVSFVGEYFWFKWAYPKLFFSNMCSERNYCDLLIDVPSELDYGRKEYPSMSANSMIFVFALLDKYDILVLSLSSWISVIQVIHIYIQISIDNIFLNCWSFFL